MRAIAAEIVERVSGRRLRELEAEEIFEPLGMSRSALGLGRFQLHETVRVSTGGGAYTPSTAARDETEEEEFGANSLYWRDQVSDLVVF